MAPLIALIAGFLLARLAGLLGIDSLDDWQAALRVGLVLMFVLTGGAHFAPKRRDDLVAMVPPALPRPGLLVTVTGVLELAGAIGLLIPATARWAAAGLALLMLAMFPANVSAARRAWPWAAAVTPLGIRTILQIVFVAAALTISLGPNSQGAKLAGVELRALDDAPLGRLIVIAGHVLDQRWRRFLAEKQGLTPAGMAVLMTLHQHGELAHRAVADRCFVRPATLTGVVDTLERDGMVERHRDQADRRTVRLVLTSDGLARIEALTALIKSGRPLTSVDADPAKAAVIREFLLELIGSAQDGEARMSTAVPSAGDGREFDSEDHQC